MILNASNKIAVKCSSCGEYNLSDINIFKIKEPLSIKCSCGQTLYSVKKVKEDIVFDITCLACEEIHSYRYKIRELLTKRINIISCSVSGMEIAFGKRKGCRGNS